MRRNFRNILQKRNLRPGLTINKNRTISGSIIGEIGSPSNLQNTIVKNSLKLQSLKGNQYLFTQTPLGYIIEPVDPGNPPRKLLTKVNSKDNSRFLLNQRKIGIRIIGSKKKSTIYNLIETHLLENNFELISFELLNTLNRQYHIPKSQLLKISIEIISKHKINKHKNEIPTLPSRN